jgi:serine/threonine-protein kinase
MGDRYQITERVDQGGMAEVFRGVAESLQGFKKSVAIKRILPSLTKNKKFVSMFLDEARLSLHLQHANIVHVFDIGMSDTTYFIVMEYVDGANLKGVIEFHKKHSRRFAVAQTIYLMIEVCKGLAYAHDASDPMTGKQLGIVHRDISPPNILISRNGEVKLVDFGLAKATSQLETTDPGVVKGKFSYLSPEAASGQEVDHRADIFAVGILLWEMLTGKRLFYGETDYQTVELVRQAKVPSIQALNRDVDPDLEAVVRKSLARDPADRFQHAADLQEALAQVLFSRGLKVTSRDIARLVQEVVADREKSKPRSQPSGSLIDALINEEIVKFTSLDDLGGGSDVPVSGQKPLSPEDVGGNSPLDPGSFVDPRSWADESQPIVVPAAARRSVPMASAPAPAARPQQPAPRTSAPQFDSLQQILEPDRSGLPAEQTYPVGPDRTHPLLSRRSLIIAVIVLALMGGGLLIFASAGGDEPAPTQPR